MQSVSTQCAANAAPETAPTRWLCRLGPWQMEFEPGHEGDVAEWAQEKTAYWIKWDAETKQSWAESFSFRVGIGVKFTQPAFGYFMEFDPLPLAPKRVPLKLPRFYPVEEKQRWTDVEVWPMVEDGEGGAGIGIGETPDYWSVFVRLEYGGRDCVADMHTDRQAQDFAAVLMSGATWFVPAK